jgi:hypothetical protein
MRVLWLANAINILLGPCLIFGLGPFPELGRGGQPLGAWLRSAHPSLRDAFALLRQAPNG